MEIPAVAEEESTHRRLDLPTWVRRHLAPSTSVHNDVESLHGSLAAMSYPHIIYDVSRSGLRCHPSPRNPRREVDVPDRVSRQLVSISKNSTANGCMAGGREHRLRGSIRSSDLLWDLPDGWMRTGLMMSPTSTRPGPYPGGPSFHSKWLERKPLVSCSDSLW